MSAHGFAFQILSVIVPILLVETLLFICSRRSGPRGAYGWYSCLVRTLAYSPCIVVGAQGFSPMPLGTTLVLSFFGLKGGIIWLYGLPELFVGVVCFLMSFGVRLIGTPSKASEVGPREAR